MRKLVPSSGEAAMSKRKPPNRPARDPEMDRVLKLLGNMPAKEVSARGGYIGASTIVSWRS